MDDQQNKTAVSVPEVPSEVQNPPVSDTSQTQPEGQSSQNALLIVGLVVVLVLVVGGVVGYMIFSNKSDQKVKTSPVIVSPSPVVSPKAVSDKSVSTSSSELSKDDSVETLKKELNQTSIDNFSSDFQGVEKDVNGL